MNRWLNFIVLLNLAGMVGRAIAGEYPTRPAGGSPICLVGHWDGYTGLYSDVWGDGDYAYLPNWGADGNEGRVHIIDISDPSNPTLASTFFVPPPNQNASPQDVKVANGLLFIALEGANENDSAAIVDVRDPTQPALLATVRIAGFEGLHNLFYDSGYLYLAASGGSPPDVAIVDLTSFDPDNPPSSPITTAKWLVTDVGADRVHDITVRNGRLYAAAWNSGLWIFDVTDVATTAPSFLGSVGGSATHSMWPTDDGQFVVTGEERSGGGIKVYRITAGAGSLSLTLTDSLVLTGASSVHNQVFVGNRLYNSWYGRGLQVLDVDPTSGLLQPVGSFDTSNSGTGNWGVYPLLGSDRILLSDTEEGLFIVTETCTCQVAQPPSAESLDGQVVTKNRMISFSAGEPGRLQAVRVTLADLPPPYDLWNGQSLWVTEPTEVNERAAAINPSGTAPRFFAAKLTCNAPAFLDWSEFSPLHVFHEGIVPSGTYRIQVLDLSCTDVTDEGSFSPALNITTALWGDTVKDLSLVPPSPPDGSRNIDDALAVLRRFSNVAGAPAKARTDLEPRCLDLLVNVSDALAALSGFAGLSYPFATSASTACDSACPNPLPKRSR